MYIVIFLGKTKTFYDGFPVFFNKKHVTCKKNSLIRNVFTVGMFSLNNVFTVGMFSLSECSHSIVVLSSQPGTLAVHNWMPAYLEA